MKYRALTFTFLLGFTFAFGVADWSENAAAGTVQRASLSAAKKKNAVRHPRPRQGQIACTFNGCQRIPARCHPEPDFDFWGNPTGFDKVVCQ